MPQDQVIRDPRGITLGRIATDATGRQRAYNTRGISLGEYDPRTNKTTDPRGITIVQGNILAALIMQSKN
jgi:hypothetical protein